MQNTFSINDIVWAKVKGCIELTIIKTYLDPWWPARIARIVRTKENDQKYLVNFIGHNSQ